MMFAEQYSPFNTMQRTYLPPQVKIYTANLYYKHFKQHTFTNKDINVLESSTYLQLYKDQITDQIKENVKTNKRSIMITLHI